MSSVFLGFFRGVGGEERMGSGVWDKMGRKRGGCVKERGGVFESVKKM